MIRDAAGELAGAVGISGDAPESDETCAVRSIGRAGLVADTGDPAWRSADPVGALRSRHS